MLYKLQERFPAGNQPNQVLFVEGNKNHSHTQTIT